MMLPSVTQIIRVWADFSRIRPEVLEAAANRGTDIHHICLNHAAGLWTPPELITPYQGYFDSFRRWMDETVVEVVGIELALQSDRWQYCGRPDMVCRFKGFSKNSGEIIYTVIDLKTPLAMARTWAIQTAAYREMLNENGYDVQRHGTVRLKKGGQTGQFNGFTKEFSLHWNVFLSCLNAYNYFRR